MLKSLIRHLHTENYNSLQSLKRLCTVAPNALQETPEEVDKLYKVVELELKGNDPAVLKSFAQFATATGSHLNIAARS